jgi:hypothetical protein
MALADLQLLVQKMVSEDGGVLTDADRASAIGLAVLRYSGDVPRELVRDTGWLVEGFLGPLPPDWVDGSTLRSAEYPIGQHPRSLIGVALYADAGGSLLVAEQQILPAGAEVRITFAAPHQLDEDTDTIPAMHREAVASYAAHVLCRQLATRYSAEREASVGADHSNTESRARNYAARAKEYRAAYYVGIDQIDPYLQGGAGGASSIPAVASVGSWPARQRYSLTRFNAS